MKITEKYVRLIPWEAEALYKYLKALGFPSIQPGFGNKRWAQESREVYNRLKNSRKVSDQECVISRQQAQAIRTTFMSLSMIRKPEGQADALARLFEALLELEP